MKINRYPFDYRVRDAFPNARVIRGYEGGCLYRAERDGRPFLILDEGTLADLLDPADKDMLGSLVTVIEFQDEVELENYVSEKLVGGVNFG